MLSSPQVVPWSSSAVGRPAAPVSGARLLLRRVVWRRWQHFNASATREEGINFELDLFTLGVAVVHFTVNHCFLTLLCYAAGLRSKWC